MPRGFGPRKIGFLPEVVYFKPWGVPTPFLGRVSLGMDELEAIRLCDFEEKEQKEAAKEMKISQSTFQRILKRARKKVAEALVVGKAITIEGGETTMMPRPRGGMGPGLRGRAPVAGGRGRGGGPYAAGPGGVCVCTNKECLHEIPHQVGVACYTIKCPKCGSEMIRKVA